VYNTKKEMHLSHGYIRFIPKLIEKEEMNSINCFDISTVPRVPETSTYFYWLGANIAWNCSKYS
jgi:hypothetical protein